MSSSSDFFTQATNFGSAVSGGVDPRTGLFTVRIALGDLVGNGNLGPSLPLEMSYSPLSGADAGFGQGVSLGLTAFDTDDQVLALSTGARYKVQETGDEVILKQNKLDTVHVAKDEDQDVYRITHKSGDVEILTGPGNAFALKVPTALLTPAGRRLTLTWDFTGPQPRLTQVDDESDTLLTVVHGDSKATLSVLPGQAEGYDVELWFQNGLLGSVRHFGLGQDGPLVWSFTYDSQGQQGEWGPWITGVAVPGGMSETVTYRNDGQGHQFPDSAGLPPLPYVHRFVRTPGGGQPPIEVTYDYTDNNFLGGNSGVSWDPDRDNLYDDTLSSYTYGSTESRVCGDRTTTITRVYDQYHLQTRETAQQNGSSRSLEIDYYAVVGQTFAEQPAQFQLPKTRTVTWTDAQGRSRSEVTETSFDSAGNPQSRTGPDGIRTDWEYYPADGSGGDCPPDPNGFTRLLAAVTRTPPGTDFDAPAHRTSYRYAAYTDLPDPRVSTAVLKSEESHHGDDLLLARKTFAYSTSGAESGRITGLVETAYPDGDGGASYTATHSFAFSARQDALVQSHTFTSHDDLTVTRSQTRSRFTGRLRSATDPQGNVTTVTHDGLGRVLTRTVNPGTLHEAEESYAYITDGEAPFVVTFTDALGNQLRESLDGAGRPVRWERKDIDGDGAWYTVRTLGYDEQGRTSSVSELDHVRDGGQVELTRTLSYDDWGRLSTTTFNDGAVELTRTDPVRLTTTSQQLGGGAPATGTVVTTYNSWGEAVSAERFDLTGASAGRQTWECDGWGRQRRETDAAGNTTRYDYDARGRLVTTTLPDGTQVSRDYAPSSPDALVTGIAVNGASYGTQTFDGLGRLTTSNSGGRSWDYDYTRAADPLPSSVITPDLLNSHQFVPELDNALSQVQAGSLTQVFTRDPVSGSLTNARSGDATTVCDYYPSGRPRTETTKLSGQPDRTTSWSYTVGGLQQSCTGVDGTTQQITRDTYGRVSAVADPAVQVSLTYDTIGRPATWVAKDTQSGQTLTTSLTRDDFGREVERTVTDSQGVSWTLTQTWQPDDLLGGRTFSRGGTTLREESFTYTSRNQLATYDCAGQAPPLDERGNAVTRQTFGYDAYGNVTRCRSEFSDGSDTATYLFENASDPCQLTGITHTHPSFPSRIDLGYDEAGRLTTDDAGRTLTYDALGRLQSVGSASRYGYDPLNRLLTQTTDGSTSVLYYQWESLASVIEGDRSTRLLQLEQAYVAQRREGAQAETLLLGSDGKGTVLVTGAGQQREEYSRTPYGDRPAGVTSSVLGFDGERTDPALGWYHLGNGYRPYHPGMMRFTAPDELSPFGAGGINPYAYCLGDPVNRVDPSGHLSWMAWLGIGLGIAGLALAVVTAGASIAAAGGVMAAVSAAETTTLVVGAVGVVSDVTAIASGALEEASPKASSVLGWVSLGTGLAGLAEAGVTAARWTSRISELAEDAEDAGRVETGTTRGAGHSKPKQKAITEKQWKERRNFKAVKNRHRQEVYVTQYEAVGRQLPEVIRSAQVRAPKVAILSGTHGAEDGLRTFAHRDSEFYEADLRFQRLEKGSSVKVYDTPNLPEGKLERILNRKDTAVIAAFCYSRNDNRLREILKLKPTVSYVTP
ncbi:RHS repeat-associated core domain-containing protein [Streptomyces lushanensis]|uniref:RHS repeat-associated core domain-containing protein n=1 Tax=Streptomyces lushanensis TaxID=1434255 RepID=UPI00082DE96D|nr:RHS repeat-associated core domain-containing protein [Streptomyces lushanensis]